MEEVVRWINTNDGITNVLISIMSLIIASTAIIISLLIANRQNKIELFEKRYEIYSRFAELIKLAEMVSSNALTLKGKMMFFNTSFFGINTESSNLGSEIVKLEEALVSIDLESEEYKNIFDKRTRKVLKKNVLDYAILIKDELLLEKYQLLYGERYYELLKEFFNIYSNVVISANFIESEKIDAVFEKWNKVCIKLREEKFLEYMKVYLNLNK